MKVPMSLWCVWTSRVGFPINISPLQTFMSKNVISNVDLSAVNLFICLLFIWLVPGVFPASIFLCLCFPLRFLNRSFFLFGLGFAFVVRFWRDREWGSTRLNFSTACLFSQIYKKLVDFVRFSFQFRVQFVYIDLFQFEMDWIHGQWFLRSLRVLQHFSFEFFLASVFWAFL